VRLKGWRGLMFYKDDDNEYREGRQPWAYIDGGGGVGLFWWVRILV